MWTRRSAIAHPLIIFEICIFLSLTVQSFEACGFHRFKDNLMTKLMSGTERQFDVIRRYSIAFLEMHVAKRKKSTHVLKQTDSMLTRYEKELDLDKSQRDIIPPGGAEQIVSLDARTSGQ